MRGQTAKVAQTFWGRTGQTRESEVEDLTPQ